MREADCLSLIEIQNLILLYEAKGRTLAILDSIGRNPLPMDMLSNKLTLEYLKQLREARVKA